MIIRNIIIIMFLSLNSLAQQPTSFFFTPTNSSGTIYGQAQINGLAASSSDWIAAFDSSGNCCGASSLIINSGIAYIDLVIYGDDGTTPLIDEGMSGVENFSLKLYVASSGQYIDYPSNSGVTYFNGWLNTNGAPIPNYSNVTDIYNFQTTSNVSLNLNVQLCENGSPIQLTGGSPSGGNYFGIGVSNNIFDPTNAGSGNHTVTYVVNGDSASSMAIVYALPDATFTIADQFCDNESNILITSVTTGGYYSGSGVISNTFNPDILGAGSFLISYTLTDANSCTQTENLLITVNPSPDIPIITQNAGVLECTSVGVTYQWLDASMNPIAGEVNSTFNPLSDGTYYVEVSNANCFKFSEEFILSTLSTNEMHDLKINLSGSLLNIRSLQHINQILIFDIFGRLVHRSKQSTIDISHFKIGVYFLKIKINDKINIYKLSL
jgi:hypothetical protein